MQCHRGSFHVATHLRFGSVNTATGLCVGGGDREGLAQRFYTIIIVSMHYIRLTWRCLVMCIMNYVCVRARVCVGAYVRTRMSVCVHVG